MFVHGAIQQSSPNKLSVLWLPCALYDALCSEGDRKWPYETGGVLLGYRDKLSDVMVVREVIDPGPGAIHRRHYFVPDHEYQLAEIARLYRESKQKLEYLGDWHTHPKGTGNLSFKDCQTLRRIAKDPAARAPRPIMLILSEGSPWIPFAWQGHLYHGMILRSKLYTYQMEVYFSE